MARNSYTLDGVPLTHPELKYFPEKSTGVRVLPAKRLASISYPGVDGDAFLSGASFAPGSVRIKMYIEGADHLEFMENLEYVNGLFLQRHKLLQLRHDYDVDGNEARIAYTTFTSGSEPQMNNGMRSGTMDYMATIPGVFWRSEFEQIVSIPTITTTPSVVTLSALSGANAPITDALIRIKGGFSSLTLSDIATGSTLTVNTALAAGEYVIVDPVNWTARKVTSDTWDGGTSIDQLVVSNKGYGSMFTLEPSMVFGELLYQVQVSATNPVSPRVEIRTKKSYL